MIQGIASPGGGGTLQGTGTRAAMWLAHLIGGALGGSLIAIVAWVLLTPIRTLLPAPSAAVVVVGIGFLSALIDLRIISRPLHGRQVPSVWYRRYGPVRAYWMFGFFLGGGLTAHVPHAATYSAFAAMSMLTSLPQAIIVGVTFGVARTLVIGPAALLPGMSARVLYTSRSSRWAIPKLSAGLSGLLIVVVLTSLF